MPPKMSDTYHKPSDSKEPEQTNAVPGTWQTNSMVNAEDGSMGPTYLIQFTATEIKYGHMKDGAFVEEYSDKISHLEKTIEGKFLVQAESGFNLRHASRHDIICHDIIRIFSFNWGCIH